ncbi:MAG: hypothetical protein HOE53_02575 [Candidatus Magasanikbacteria bacterium]|jgi:uncharacterized protein|nr:hypothetical protein [Candidatus Magasanikbacteria bacterium]
MMKQLYVIGLHCASCELIIEKELLKRTDVTAADVSMAQGTVRLEVTGEGPSVESLNRLFVKEKYSFSLQKQEKMKGKEPLLYTVPGQKGVKVDWKQLQKRLTTPAIFVVVLYAAMLLERSNIGQFISLDDSSSLPVFFVFGIVAGLSSCAALIGGIVLSLSKSFDELQGGATSLKARLLPHMQFYGGRLLAYTIFGAVLGGFGSFLTFNSAGLYATLIVMISVIMGLIGLQMAGVSWAQRFAISLPKRFVKAAGTKEGSRLPSAIGAATVLLPCGFTLVVQGVALAAGNVISGALMMLAFALGTVIPLLAISVAGVKASSKPHWRARFSLVAGMLLVVFAVYNINAQFNVLGWKSLSDVGTATVEEGVAAAQNGVQVVSLKASGFTYTPTGSMTINANQRAQLQVDNQGMQGCGLYIASRGLFDGFVALKPGMNVIDIGSPKKGTYKISCSMGMVRPVTLRVI